MESFFISALCLLDHLHLPALTSRPILISPPWAILNFLSHPPIIFLTYLLFSPSPSRSSDQPSSNHRLLRLVLTLPFAFLAIYVGFLFRIPDPIAVSKNDGFAVQGLVASLRALEAGLRREKPVWLGWEDDESDEQRERRRRAANDAGSVKKRLALAVSYFYSYRSLGWSTGPGKGRYKRRLRESYSGNRWKAAWPVFLKMVTDYLLFDCAATLWSLHPYFGHLSTLSHGSIYTPLVIPLPSSLASSVLPKNLTIPSLLSASFSAYLLAFSIYISQSFTASLVGTLSILLSSNPRSASLHYPAFFDNWTLSDSLSDLWGIRWHGLYQAVMRFVGYGLGQRIAGRAGAVVGTFLVSGLFHAIGYYSPTPLGRELAARMLIFFLGNAIFLLVEISFTRLSGVRVRGSLGRLWTWSALLSLGIPLADTWLRAGAGAGLGGEDGVLPFSPIRTVSKQLGLL